MPDLTENDEPLSAISSSRKKKKGKKKKKKAKKAAALAAIREDLLDSPEQSAGEEDQSPKVVGGVSEAASDKQIAVDDSPSEEAG